METKNVNPNDSDINSEDNSLRNRAGDLSGSPAELETVEQTPENQVSAQPNQHKNAVYNETNLDRGPEQNISFPDEEIKPVRDIQVEVDTNTGGALGTASTTNTNPKHSFKSIDPDLKNLRTYEDDVTSAVQNNNITTTKIVMAEQVKREQAKQTISGPQAAEKTEKKPLNKKVLVVIVSIVLFISGGAGIYYNLEYLKPYFENRNQPRIHNEVKIIDANSNIFINSQGKTRGEIIRDFQTIVTNSDLSSANEIIEVIITKEVTREVDGNRMLVTERISNLDFFNLIDANVPDSLSRSFNDKVVIGVHKKNTASPFVILQSENLGQTYSGMLIWERNLGNDMRNIFFRTLTAPQPEPIQIPPSGDGNEVSAVEESMPPTNELSENQTDENEILENEELGENATSPEEGNPVSGNPTFNIRNFVDIVIANKDVRAIVNSDGEILFFYSLVDNENVVMATDRETLVLVLDRINRAKLLQ